MSDQPNTSAPQSQPAQAPTNYPFPKSAEGLLPWSFAEERLLAAQNYWLATVRSDGRPHVTPLWGVWIDGALYFDGSPATRWARNIAANANAAAHLESGKEVVILEGTAEDLPSVSDAELAVRIVAAWDGKYNRLHPEPATRGIFRLLPRTARAWSQSGMIDGTRWVFGS